MARRRRSRESVPDRIVHTVAGSCASCGKTSFLSRADARKARKSTRTTGLNIYPCPDDPAVFHLGHLPASVVRGEISRDDI